MSNVLDNQAYYFITGSGRWQGRFTFRLTSWSQFLRAKLGFKYRFLVLGMFIMQKLTGSSKIFSEVRAFPGCCKAGVATNVVVIKKFGITVYLLREQYILHPNGRQVTVRSKERFGPLPFLFRSSKHHPAEVMNGGRYTRYLDMPILGTLWTGEYTVLDKDHIDAKLRCAWAEANEVIERAEAVEELLPIRSTSPPPLKDLTDVSMRLYEYRDRYESIRDRRATFTHAYARITEAFNNELSKVSFADKAWIVRLDIAFATEYLNALDAYDLNNTKPPGWSPVFAALEKDRTSVLEELLISMTAHIVHDLPFALREAGVGETDPRPRIRDFQTANDVLQLGIDDIQDVVAKRYNPFLRLLDSFARRDDEFITNYGIRASRAVAWYNTERLADPATHAITRASVQKSCEKAVALILDPPWFTVRILWRFLRWMSALGRIWPEYRSAR